MNEVNTATVAVEHLKAGMLVDLESCPYLKDHATASEQYAEVESVVRETDECIVVAYEGIDQVGYKIGTQLVARVARDVPDPEIQVEAVGSTETVWRISQNLTDRWGDINDYNAENKPLELLQFDTELLERLRGQMWDEMTFVARKDGQFGILFEVEYTSKESEEGAGLAEDLSEFNPHDVVVAALKEGLAKLVDRFPGVSFCVPDKSQIIHDRPAVWAFMPDGMLDAEQRRELGLALLDL